MNETNGVINNGTAYSTARNLYYEQLQDAEPTEEQVKEYCRKRGLVIVTSELFNEMKARWSADPVRHGHWIFNPKDAIEMMSTLPKCSECGAESSDGGNYCSHCGAKMDEEVERKNGQ